jgi:type I restriction enzyme S subunit
MRDGWTETSISEVLLVSIGGIWGIDVGTDEMDVHVYRQTEFNDDGKLTIPSDAQRSISANQLKSRKIQPGDILLQKSAGTPTLPGRVVQVPLGVEENATCSNFLHLLRADSNMCDPKFLFFELWFRHKSGGAFEFQRGTNIRNLDLNQYLAQPLNLPPLGEQKRIVDVVSSVDSYIDSLQRQADAARTARNAVLHELLDAVASAPQKKLKDLTSKIGSGATPRGGESVYQESGVSLIRSQNVHNGRFLHEGLVAISDSAAAALNGVTVEGDDVLINITGASVARACMVDAEILPARVNQHVAILRADSNQLLPCFLLQILLGKKMNSYLLDISGSGTTRQAITKAQLEDLEVPIPLLAEQKRIVDIVSSMDDVVQATEQAVTDAKNLRSGLLSDLLSGNHAIPESYDEIMGAA